MCVSVCVCDVRGILKREKASLDACRVGDVIEISQSHE